MKISRLPPPAVAGLAIPDDTKRVLSERGIPDDLRLPGWGGPTLFTSEIQGSVLPRRADSLAGDWSSIPEGYVIGTIRETEGMGAGDMYASFIVTSADGRILLVDAVDPKMQRFVSSSLDLFLDSLNAFYEAWPRLAREEDAAVSAAVSRLRDAMTRLDHAAWESDDHYWPTWFEEFEV